MPRRATPLTAQKVAKAKPGRFYDGDGLVLLVREASTFDPSGKLKEHGKAWWLYRYTLRGKTRDLGLGRALGPNSVSLADARIAAKKARDLVKAGTDPLAEREAEEARKLAAEALAAASRVTFEEMGGRYIAAHQASWRNPKHRQQWKNTLKDYVYPKIGHIAVAEVGTAEVTSIIEPIWNEKPETAGRVRGRIEAILDYAKARGFRDGENPARWRGHLDHLLPARSKVRRVEHHAALPWKDIGAFIAKLRTQNGRSSLAVEFAILTASRSNEVRGLRWKEIDLEAALWTVPATRMKAGLPHRVPLSARAVEILRGLEDLRKTPDDLVFPGGREGGELSDVALSKAAKNAAGTDVTVHGFRSTFRDWCGEATNYPRELAEKALAHALASEVEAAYARGDQIEKRARLMEDWAKFCDKPMPAPGGNVTLIRAVG
jgi:integrase